MSFSYGSETLTSGILYDSRTQPKMSAHGDENTEAETGINEGSKENRLRFSELVD